jgi:hypothetical protein
MFRIHAGVLTLILLMLSHPGMPQAADYAGESITRREAQAITPRSERKSKMLNAYAWGVGGTVLPLAAAIAMGNLPEGNEAIIGTLTLSGILLGPSLGQFYTGSIGQGFAGLGIRTLGGVLSIAGLATIIGDAFCGFDDSEGNESNCDENSSGGPLLLLGLATYTGGVVYSMVDTRFSVDRYFARRQDSYGVAPVLVPQGEGSLKAGALAWMRF